MYAFLLRLFYATLRLMQRLSYQGLRDFSLKGHHP